MTLIYLLAAQYENGLQCEAFQTNYGELDRAKGLSLGIRN